MKAPEGLKPCGVEEICSVSSCMSPAPENWINHWRHNELWAYDTQEIAWSVVLPELQHAFHLYAYAMYPLRFIHGEQQPFSIPELNVQPWPKSFIRLGYDGVSRSLDTNFECSPLSCNGMAERFAANRYCLIDSEQKGFELAQRFSESEPEPGPYHVVEVWRQMKAESGTER